MIRDVLQMLLDGEDITVREFLRTYYSGCMIGAIIVVESQLRDGEEVFDDLTGVTHLAREGGHEHLVTEHSWGFDLLARDLIPRDRDRVDHLLTFYSLLKPHSLEGKEMTHVKWVIPFWKLFEFNSMKEEHLCFYLLAHSHSSFEHCEYFRFLDD